MDSQAKPVAAFRNHKPPKILERWDAEWHQTAA